jgi:hypothetical protein
MVVLDLLVQETKVTAVVVVELALSDKTELLPHRVMVVMVYLTTSQAQR